MWSKQACVEEAGCECEHAGADFEGGGNTCRTHEFPAARVAKQIRPQRPEYYQ